MGSVLRLDFFEVIELAKKDAAVPQFLTPAFRVDETSGKVRPYVFLNSEGLRKSESLPNVHLTLNFPVDCERVDLVEILEKSDEGRGWLSAERLAFSSLMKSGNSFFEYQGVETNGLFLSARDRFQPLRLEVSSLDNHKALTRYGITKMIMEERPAGARIIDLDLQRKQRIISRRRGSNGPFEDTTSLAKMDILPVCIDESNHEWHARIYEGHKPGGNFDYARAQIFGRVDEEEIAYLGRNHKDLFPLHFLANYRATTMMGWGATINQTGIRFSLVAS